MPINIQHSGNVGQTIGLHYAGALGQFRQKERARQEQQALGYARIRANQQSQAFQADQQRQIAQFDAAQRWNMEEAKELARQDREALERQQGLEDIKAAEVAEEKIDRRELGQQQDAAGLLAAAKVTAAEELDRTNAIKTARGNITNFHKYQDESQTGKQKQINLEQIKDKLDAGDRELYEKSMQDIADARSDTEFRPEDNYKIMQEAWQNILGIKDRVTPDMLPNPLAEAESQNIRGEDGNLYHVDPETGSWTPIKDPVAELRAAQEKSAAAARAASQKKSQDAHKYKDRTGKDIIPDAFMTRIFEEVDAGRESQLSPEHQEALGVWREKSKAAYRAVMEKEVHKEFKETWKNFLDDWDEKNPKGELWDAYILGGSKAGASAQDIEAGQIAKAEKDRWTNERSSLGIGSNGQFDYERAVRLLSTHPKFAPSISPDMIELYGGGAAAGGAAVGGAAAGEQPTGAGGSVELYPGGGAGGQQPAPPATGEGDRGWGSTITDFLWGSPDSMKRVYGDTFGTEQQAGAPGTQQQAGAPGAQQQAGAPGTQQPPPAGAPGEAEEDGFASDLWKTFRRMRAISAEQSIPGSTGMQVSAQGQPTPALPPSVARVGGKLAPWYTSPEQVAIAEDRKRPEMEKYEAEIEEYEAEIAANEQFIEETMERIEATEGEYVQEGDVGEEDIVWKEGAQGEDVKQLEKFIKQAEEHNKGRQEQIKGKQGKIDKWDEELTRYKSNIESGNIYGAVSINEFSTMDQLKGEAKSIKDEFGTIDLKELTKKSKAAATPTERRAWDSAIKRVQAFRKHGRELIEREALNDAGATAS